MNTDHRGERGIPTEEDVRRAFANVEGELGDLGWDDALIAFDRFLAKREERTRQDERERCALIAEVFELGRRQYDAAVRGGADPTRLEAQGNTAATIAARIRDDAVATAHRLHDAWQHTVRARAHTTTGAAEDEADRAEQLAYDELVDHIETHGLNYTAYDPRSPR